MSSLVIVGPVFTGTQYFDRGVVVVDQQKGVIVDVGKKGEVDEPKDAIRVTAEGGTILPGLIDAHLHLGSTKAYGTVEWNMAPEPYVAVRGVADLYRLFSAGFTTVRDMGTKVGTYLSRCVDEGLYEGPRVVACSKILSRTGGGDDLTILPIDMTEKFSYSYHSDGPWECRKAVRRVLRDGAKFVKIMNSAGDWLFPPPNGEWRHSDFTVEEVKAIVDEAHRAGLKVSAHANGEESISDVVESGVDSIDHGIGLTPEIAESMKKKGIFYCPTLTPFINTHEKERAVATLGNDSDWNKVIDIHFNHDMKLAKDFGLKIVAGTDMVGFVDAPHGGNYSEIVHLAKVFGNREAIVAATVTAAECLGLGSCGQLKKGYEADIVVAKGNPLEDIEALSPGNILHVIRKGRLHVKTSWISLVN